jgi:hypothetical protein
MGLYNIKIDLKGMLREAVDSMHMTGIVTQLLWTP